MPLDCLERSNHGGEEILREARSPGRKLSMNTTNAAAEWFHKGGPGINKLTMVTQPSTDNASGAAPGALSAFRDLLDRIGVQQSLIAISYGADF